MSFCTQRGHPSNQQATITRVVSPEHLPSYVKSILSWTITNPCRKPVGPQPFHNQQAPKPKSQLIAATISCRQIEPRLASRDGTT